MKLPPSKREQIGFTLIELLIVVAIISILIAIGLASYSRVQKSARDSQRKSDLRNVAGALENFYADYNKYPEASSGKIVVYATDCTTNGTSSTLDWGTGNFSCASKTYMKQLPADPLSSNTYTYIVSGDKQTFCLVADLEVNPSSSTNCPGGLGSGDFVVSSRD
jgi:type IV pilus assembly protein PilE